MDTDTPDTQDTTAAMSEELTEFPTKFTDEKGRTWTVRISLALAREFCADHHIRMGEFTAAHIDQAQLLDIAYRATRWETKARAAEESFESFLASLEGPAYGAALEAAANALANFTLRYLVPRERQQEFAHIARTVRDAHLAQASPGPGGPSAACAPKLGYPLPTKP